MNKNIDPRLTKISCCEVCDNEDITVELDLGHHPLSDDLVKFGDERKNNEYPITIGFCGVCNTAHQIYQVPKTELFHKDYSYRARMTGSVLRGMSDLVDSIEERFGDLNQKKVLDIGSNDGSLLNYFEEKGAKTFGVEPTRAALESRHQTINAFFDEDSSMKVKEEFGSPDFITFTNVFAHIEDLNGLLANLKNLITDNTILVIENHYLGACLETGQFDTFYHEHPRTYSKKSFDFIAEKLGLGLIDVQFVSRYGGNIRAYMGKSDMTKSVEVDETNFLDLFKEMNEDLSRWKGATKQEILSIVEAQGKIKAKAFPGRATILIKLLGLDEKHISAVYEITGSIKVDHYVPGTRIPILPEAKLYSDTDQDELILNLAWHLPEEVRANLTKNGYRGEVIDIKKANFKG
tara:strand:- start:196 stop:1413 length:1218 start_codon:yes stop_codon:yes gene_type:complete